MGVETNSGTELANSGTENFEKQIAVQN